MGQTAEALMPGGFRKIADAPMAVQRLQQTVDEATKAARTHPRATSNTVAGVVIPDSGATPNTVTVQHKLGHKPNGYNVVRNTVGHAQFFETSSDAHSVTLQSSSTTATVDLEFF